MASASPLMERPSAAPALAPAPAVSHAGGCESLEGRALRYSPGRRGPEILKGVSTGRLPRGSLCAVMGASGSGKTTLLKVLASRLKETAGEVLVDDVPRVDRKRWKQLSSLIPQEDVLPRSLTPRQVLGFQARLHGLSAADDVAAAVDAVLDRLQLSKCADTRIGDGHTLQGLSGGERKRCSVALELLKHPQILLLDECTSGLDGPMALELVSMLRALCKGDGQGEAGEDSGRLLAVCTIHQPSSKVFALFDHLILLRNGEVVYAGPRDAAASYFEGLHPMYKVPAQTNPAEHFLEILSGQAPPPIMAMVTDASSASRPAVALTSSQATQAPSAAGGYSTSFSAQAWLLFRRTIMMRTRDPAQFRVRVVLSAVVASILGLTYWQVAESQGTLTDRQAVMFGCLVFLTMNTMMTTAIQFPLEKAFIFREYHNGSYRLAAWYWANLVASLLLQLFFSLIYVSLLYTMVGLRGGIRHFLLYLAVCSLMGCIGVVLGNVLGVALPAVHMVTAVVPPLIMPQLIFSGFMIRPGNIPIYFKVFYYLSFFQYSFRLILTDQLMGFELDPCDPFAGEFCPLGFGSQPGDLWLTRMLGYDLSTGALATCWGALGAMCIGFALIGYWVAKRQAAKA